MLLSTAVLEATAVLVTQLLLFVTAVDCLALLDGSCLCISWVGLFTRCFKGDFVVTNCPLTYFFVTTSFLTFCLRTSCRRISITTGFTFLYSVLRSQGRHS